MAATYSPNLKIELIGAGEQAGVWGDTTNTNLGTTIEQAISGYGEVPVDGDGETVLNYSNTNGSQAARCFTLNVTGLLSGSENVVVPTIEKSYIVQNNTSGGYNIVVKTALGSGVTVPNGKSMFVYVDGTNVVEAITHTPVSSGGTGASSLAANNVLIGNGTSAVQTVAPGTSGNLLTSNGSTWTSTAPAPAVLTGSLMMWPTGSAPSGYLLCDGTTYNEGDYPELFGVIQRTFGGNAGAGTFKVPNYINRMPVGAGDLYSSATTGGSKDAVVVSHNHTTGNPGNFITGGITTSFGGSSGYLIGTSGVISMSSGTTNHVATAGPYQNITFYRNWSISAGSHTHTISTSGSSGTNANLPPYLGIYFIIKT